MNRYACGVATGMALALSMAAAPLTAGAAKPAGAGSKRAPAPNVQMTTTAGRRMDLASLRGRVVIVNFWATWCPSCRAALPSLAALYTQYLPRIEMIGVALDQGGAKVVVPFAQRQGIPYPLVIDTEDRLPRAFGGIRGIPTTFVIDQEGRIYKKYVGYPSQEVFERDIKALLRE